MKVMHCLVSICAVLLLNHVVIAYETGNDTEKNTLSLAKLFSRCKEAIDERRINDAEKMLIDANVENLVSFEFGHGSPRFLAIGGIGPEFHGLPTEFSGGLKNDQWMEIPGTGCGERYYGDIWGAAAAHFCFRYNLLAFHKYRTENQVAPRVTLDEAQEMVCIDDRRWRSLALESRLRIQYFVAEWIETKQAQIDAQNPEDWGGNGVSGGNGGRGGGNDVRNGK